MLQAILFDLDGTLLPMDNDAFIKYYFNILAREAYQWGYTDSGKFMEEIWAGVIEMMKDDGSVTNDVKFWRKMVQDFGPEFLNEKSRLVDFYSSAFHEAAVACNPKPELARRAVELAHRHAEHVILATNPTYPREADISRMSWAGLTEEDFDLITDYENSCHSKPNPQYYRDIMELFSLDPAKCLMVGNDAAEDMEAAGMAGIKTFLITDYLINRKGLELNCPYGNFEDLIQYLENIE